MNKADIPEEVFCYTRGEDNRRSSGGRESFKDDFDRGINASMLEEVWQALRVTEKDYH